MLTIELFGLSRTGKTSVVRGLTSRLEGQGAKCAVIGRPIISFQECGGLENFHSRLLEYLESSLGQNKATKPDYIIMDRGPYDREVMLDADHDDGQVSTSFFRETKARIIRLQNEIDIPFLFLIDPTTSLQRVHSQRDEGLDYAHLCAGLNTRDNTRELQGLFDRYASLKTAKKSIVSAYTRGNTEDTIQSALEAIKSKRGVN